MHVNTTEFVYFFIFNFYFHYKVFSRNKTSAQQHWHVQATNNNSNLYSNRKIMQLPAYL